MKRRGEIELVVMLFVVVGILLFACVMAFVEHHDEHEERMARLALEPSLKDGGR